jgi:saccharopine dehydrogenase-like NADP-dependent oxidoreductase
MKILLVGAGGVGLAFCAIAARRDFFEHIVVADYDEAKAREAAEAVKDLRFSRTVSTPVRPTTSPR